MGLSCCKGKAKKYQQLEKASKMKRTAKNKVITAVTLKILTTKAQRNAVVNNKNISGDLKQVMTPPYSSFDQITDSIFLTGTGGMIKENIAGHHITCIINATFEAPNYSIEGIESIRVPVDDDPAEDLYPYFDDVADKINEVTLKKGRTLVHCVAGVSRSTTLVLAYLMKYKNMSLRDAFLYVRQKRDVIKPKVAFFYQLIHYEKELFGKNSVRMLSVTKMGLKFEVPDFYLDVCTDLLEKEVGELKGGAVEKEKIISEYSERSVL